MTTINQALPSSAAPRSYFVNATQQTKEARTATGAAGHNETKLRQLQGFLDNLSRALGRQMHAAGRYASQLNASQQFGAATAVQLGLMAPPATLGPHGSEVLAHPEVVEELKKHRERECRLAAEVKSAIEGTERPNIELLRMFGFLDFLNPPEMRDTREDKSEVGDEPMINPHDKDASGLIWDSHSEFYEQIGQLIAALQQNWLSKYQDAMKAFLEFYEEFSDAMDKIETGSPSTGSPDNIQVNFGPMRDALKIIVEKYTGKSMASFSTRAEADAFVKSLNIPGLKISEENGEFKVMFNLDAVNDILNSLNDADGNPIPDRVHWNPARYNSWLSMKDGNVEDIKHVSKVLGEKLNEMTQKFDNIVKILSSTIDKINEADMSFVRGI